MILQVFEGRVVQGDGKSGGHVITATAGSGPNKHSFNYSTERIVGNGSFGVVFQATCLETAETVRHDLMYSPICRHPASTLTWTWAVCMMLVKTLVFKYPSFDPAARFFGWSVYILVFIAVVTYISNSLLVLLLCCQSQRLLTRSCCHAAGCHQEGVAG